MSNKLGALSAAVLVLVLMVCSLAAADELQPVRFRLDWKAGAQHSPFYVAQAKGFFAEEGLDVEIIGGSGSAVSLKQVGSKAIEFAMVDAPVLIQGQVKGVPAKAVGVYYQETPISVMWNAAKIDITSPQDLVGKKVGAKKESSSFQGLMALTAANGIDLDAIKLIPVGFGVTPLLVGQVDALMGFTMNEPLEAEGQGLTVGELMVADFGVKMYGLTISTHTELLEKQPELVRGFIRAAVKGIEYTVQNPDEAMQIIKKAIPDLNLDDEINVWKKIDATVLRPEDEDAFLSQTLEGWQATQDTLYDLGIIESKVEPAQIFQSL